MAKIREIDLDAWNAWVASRPESVQALCRRLPPDRLYRMSPVGQRVELVAYNENGTVTVAVLGRWNCVFFERQVFGVDPDSLTECDLPTEGEQLGVALTDDEADGLLDALREQRSAENN